MGNQLAVSGAAATINLNDVSSNLSLMAPLGGTRRGRLFTSLHCRLSNPSLVANSNTSDAQSFNRGISEVVVKVFVRNPEDKLQAQLISQHHDALITVEKKLCAMLIPTSSPLQARKPAVPRAAPTHALFYTEMDRRSDRFCKLQRPYIHFSLVERLQTRPFCTAEQRLFFAFQLLEGLAQLHDELDVVHGDLKIENCLITSHQWLYITDFAPFKPPLLPSYNPANFEFFYDNAESRVCCVAPEKFFDTPNVASSSQPPAPLLATAPPVKSLNSDVDSPSSVRPVSAFPPFSPTTPSQRDPKTHTAAMDVFSAACVIAHIMTDEPLFKLANVLELRSKPDHTAKAQFFRSILLERGMVANDPMANLLEEVICASSASRPSARDVLNKYLLTTARRDNGVFPGYFGFLHNQVIPFLLRNPPDVQVYLLRSQWAHILKTCEMCIVSHQHAVNAATATRSSGEGIDAVECPQAQRKARRGATTLLMPIIAAVLRHLKTTEAKCQVLALFSEALPDTPTIVLKETVLPFVLHLLRTPAQLPHGQSLVRATALGVLGDLCNSFVERCAFTAGESLLFDDYIFPCLSDTVARDNALIVQCTMAKNLPRILLCARYFLEQRQALTVGGGGSTSIPGWHSSYDLQLHTLVSFGWEMLKSLLKQRNSSVVLAVLSEIDTLVAFLGEERTQDELLPLLTTTMDSRIEVKRELMRQAIGCHRLLHSPRSKILQFFVGEGLGQSDIACLVNTIEALERVVNSPSCDIPADVLMGFVHQCIPHIAHPSVWVRARACRLLETAASIHRPSDLLTFLECTIRPMLTHPVPLSMLSKFPSVVKAELSWIYASSQDGASQVAQGSFPAGGEVPAPVISVGNSANATSLQGGTPTQTVMSVADLMSDDHHVDLQASMVSVGNEGDSTWVMSFSPTIRQSRRFDHRAKWETSCAEQVKTALRNRAITKAQAAPHGTAQSHTTASQVGSKSLLRPTAAALLTASAGSAVYAMDSNWGRLLTAGAQGVVKIWDLANDDYAPAQHLHGSVLREAAPSSDTVLAALFLSNSATETTNKIVLGGTDGILRSYDIEASATTSKMELALQAPISCFARVHHDQLLFAGDGAGTIHLVDFRVPSTSSSVWRSSVKPQFGPVMAALGIGPKDHHGMPTSLQPAVAVGTLSGQLLLYDLRYRIEVASYSSGHPTTSPSLSGGSKGILCISDDVMFARPAQNEASGPCVFVGTRGNGIRRIELKTGNITLTMRTHEPADVRCLVASARSSCLISGGCDRLIRLWDPQSPLASVTLSCNSRTESAPYTFSDKTINEGVPPPQGFGFAAACDKRSSSLLSKPGSCQQAVPQGPLYRQHHNDLISQLHIVTLKTSQYLVSASRDGSISVWHNAL